MLGFVGGVGWGGFGVWCLVFVFLCVPEFSCVWGLIRGDLWGRGRLAVMAKRK